MIQDAIKQVKEGHDGIAMRKRSGFQIFQSVVFALLIRELKTRFGVWRLGYFWAILEPLLSIAALSLVVTFLRGRQPWYGIPVPVFVACGFLLFLYFRILSTQAANSISSNRGLFGYRQVKPFDTLASRAVLETLIFLGTMLCMALIGYWFFGYNLKPDDPLKLIMVIILLIAFSFGLGLIFAVFGALNPELAKLLPVLNRPLLFISCVMYPFAAVPDRLKGWLIWNPLLHAIEEFRGAMFLDYPNHDTSLLYLLQCSIVLMSFGLLIYTSQRHKLVAT